MQTYTQQGYPFYGQPVNRFQNFPVGPYAGPSNALPPGFQYMPHPQNPPFMVP
jgi:hypothetical protein